MRKGRNGENGKNGRRKKIEKTSLPVERSNADQLERRTLVPKKEENSGHPIVCQQFTARTTMPELRPLECRTLVPIRKKI